MKNKIFFIIFMFIWILLVILNFTVPKKTFSEQENRNLTKWPKFSFETLITGEYQEKIEKYINDHFIFRDKWIKLETEQELILGKQENNDVYIGKEGYLFEKYEYGENEKNNITKIANIVNKFEENTKVETYFILVPNSIYINQDKLPKYAKTYDQSIIINDLYSKLNKNIQTIDVTQTLKEHKDEYIYFKTDHHINSKGAYYIYQKFNEKKGTETPNLTEYTEKEVSNKFLGTFDSKTQKLNQEYDIITTYENKNLEIEEVIYDNTKTNSIYNEEYLEKKDKYSYFLNGNNAKVIVKTNIKNGKKLLLIKDSYAHIMAQFLCNDYEEIHFIDPRYYNISITDYIEKNQIKEVLFLYNVSNIITDIGIKNIK